MSSKLRLQYTLIFVINAHSLCRVNLIGIKNLNKPNLFYVCLLVKNYIAYYNVICTILIEFMSQTLRKGVFDETG